MSIMERMFGARPVAQQPVQNNQQQMQQPPAQTQPGNIPADAVNNLQSAATPQTAPNGAIPDTPETKAKAEMDQFKDIWNITPDPNAQGNQPLFNVSQEKMLEAARKQNFAGQITPEILTKLGMSAEAGPALAELLNTVSQNAYAQSAFATTKLIEGALDKSGFARTADIDTKVKALTLNESVRSDNPLLTHAAAQPMVQLVQNQLLTKYPNATASELKDMTKKYFDNFTNIITAPTQQAQQQQQAKAVQGEDWGKFLGMES